jgi:hypothetical protein
MNRLVWRQQHGKSMQRVCAHSIVQHSKHVVPMWCLCLGGCRLYRSMCHNTRYCYIRSGCLLCMAIATSSALCIGLTASSSRHQGSLLHSCSDALVLHRRFSEALCRRLWHQ